MPQQLAYVIITPYSLHKSRTGGILSRLITRTGCELVAARMFAPSTELVNKYAEQTISANDPQDRRIQQYIYDYIVRNLSPDPKTGRRRRVMMLLFQGEDAVRKTRSVVGNIGPDRRSGESIRDTYGDLIVDENNQLRYFEPAVLAAPTLDEAEAKLKLWAQYSDTDGGILQDVIAYQPGETPQRKDVVAAKAKAAIEKELGFKIGREQEQQLGTILGPSFGDNQFENIVRFMSGRAPSECPPGEETKPGSEKCIALVYEGVGAVGKIRDVLGPTDPSKAPPGSIRREFGQTIMVNAAHASDSEENSKREIGIVNLGENIFRQVVEKFYGKVSPRLINTAVLARCGARRGTQNRFNGLWRAAGSR